MTVKYYDSLQYGIPMIVTKDSYMGKIVDEKKIGISIDWDNTDDLNKLIKNIKNFDYKTFYNNRKEEIERIIKDDIVFQKKLIHFVKNGGKNE